MGSEPVTTSLKDNCETDVTVLCQDKHHSEIQIYLHNIQAYLLSALYALASGDNVGYKLKKPDYVKGF